MKVGIVGFGYVGQALYKTIKNKKDVQIFDCNQKDLNDFEKLLGAEIIFVALPTPNCSESGEQKIFALEDFFRRLDLIQMKTNWAPLIVIKSTVLYENIKPFLHKYSIVMNPEFLNQNSSFEDALNQKIVILGGRADLIFKVESFYKNETLVNAKYEYLSHEEAINFKYLRNIYGAYKVLFWNWVHEEMGDARKYAHLYSLLPQGEMSQVAADGELGFGGACFIKDLQAMDTENPHQLTEFMQAYNNHLRNKKPAITIAYRADSLEQ